MLNALRPGIGKGRGESVKEFGPVRGPRRNNHRILVADDDDLVRKLIQTILIQQGFLPTPCPDGPSVLRRVAEKSWSLLIIDLNMPRLSGLEVLRKIRTEGDNLPAILISGIMTDDVVEECNRLGRIECFSKPFEVAHLLDLVSQLVHQDDNKVAPASPD